MNAILVKSHFRLFGLGLVVASLWFFGGISLVLAEGGSAQKGAKQGTDNLQKEITDLDSQIQKLREQSIALQEKTKAKLESQLEILKKQRDTLVPRIEKLRDNSETAWQDIKENIQKAIEDLKASVETIEKK